MYNCLKSDYGIRQEELILYGQSVGSGPTVHLASRLQKLRGVVLHSAILSGIQVLYPVKMTFWFDIFKVSLAEVFFGALFSVASFDFVLRKPASIFLFQNIDKIRHVSCPVLVIHVSFFIFFYFFMLILWFN